MRLVLLGLGALLFASACKDGAKTTSVTLPFFDDFERTELGPLWRKSGGHWEVRGGMARSNGANNAPLFLEVDLPNDLVLEVDVRSETGLVDSKIELMTNGKAHQSGYVFILGGWSNTISCIARLDEHGADRVEKKPTGVLGNRSHRWRIEKKGGDLRWYLDGKLYLSFRDEEPLEGPGHNRLAFSNWQNEIAYDNLKIWAYEAAPPLGSAGPAAGTSTTPSPAP